MRLKANVFGKYIFSQISKYIDNVYFKEYFAAPFCLIFDMCIGLLEGMSNYEPLFVYEKLCDEKETQTQIEECINENDNVSENISENVKENVSENVKESVSEIVSENVKENISENIEENVKENVSENIKENVKENVKEIVKENVKEIVKENISENDSENDSEKEQDNSENSYVESQKQTYEEPVGIRLVKRNNSVKMYKINDEENKSEEFETQTVKLVRKKYNN
jgi:hypothetical protein